MSEIEYDDFSDEEQQEPRKDPVRARLKQVEKELREKDSLLAKYADTERKMAFMEAGINASDPKFKYFVKGYDGELSAEAIQQAALEAQLITPQGQVSQEDRNAWQQTNRVAAGAETASEGPSWVKRIRDASSQEEIVSIYAEAQAQGIDLSEM
jgi:hypothetical protein